MMPEWIYSLVICISSFIFASKVLLKYLQYLQQENYYNDRFFQWVISKKIFDYKGSTIAILSGILLPFYPVYSAIIGSVILLYLFIQERDPLKTGKLTLKATPRAMRIYTITLILLIASISFSSQFINVWIYQALLFQLLPILLVIANFLLKPLENYIQQKIIYRTKLKLAQFSPYTIGITGSYGKTSSKEILGQILQIAKGNTFWPRKGINTPMGIAKEIQNNLIAQTNFAIIEMGAYKPGSIKRLCDLTPPNAGIITNIGKAHLERFKTQGAILSTKEELAKSIPAKGILVCNGDNEGALQIAEQNPKGKTLLYGFKSNYDCFISHYEFSEKGTSFTINWKNNKYNASTPLLGKTALSNIMGAFTMACSLECDPKYVISVIQNLQPVENRLQITKNEETTYIRDAYNSNPEGFEDALDVMDKLNANRKILITPGMVELGNDQYRENKRLGNIAANVCNLILFVGKTNRESFVQNLKKTKLFETRDEALCAYANMCQKGDLVLIENDLPDLYDL